MGAEFTPFFPAVKAKMGSTGGTTFSTRTQFAPVASGPAPATSFPASPGSAPSDTKIVALPNSHTHTQANIELKREGDRITQIRVRCRCGETIEIDCEY